VLAAQGNHQEGVIMSVLISIFPMAGEVIIYIWKAIEPDMKDPFWEE